MNYKTCYITCNSHAKSLCNLKMVHFLPNHQNDYLAHNIHKTLLLSNILAPNIYNPYNRLHYIPKNNNLANLVYQYPY